MNAPHRGWGRYARAASACSLLLAAPLLAAGCAPSRSSGGVTPSATTGGPEASEDIPGQFVVDFRDDAGSGDVTSLLGGLGLLFEPTALEAETRAEIATVPAARVAAVVARLTSDPRVEYVEPLARVKALWVPDDPLIKDQWHLERVGAPTAWRYSTGRGVTVAVVDTGVACEDHGPFTKGTDLAQTRCVGGYNLIARNEHANDDQGHGTHVAGTIAQSTHNGLGGAGMAFHARLMPVKVLDAGGSGTTAGVADGIRWAADHGAQIINLSLGGPRPARVLQKAIDHARSKGATVIAAAGNSGGSVGYPGGSEGVVGVSATGQDDKIARFSSRGPQVDIAAPGVDVVQQTICNGGKGGCERFPAFSGTSMATPHVAGAAAMIASLGVTHPDAVEATLAASARKVDTSEGARSLYGAGVLSASGAVQRVALGHALVRGLAVAVLGAWALLTARKKQPLGGGALASFWLAALASGVGVLFFAPLIAPAPHLALDVLARPLGDLDLLAGPHVHAYLPLANALVPLAFAAVLFGVKRARPALAGVAVGTAGYLVSAAFFREIAFPFGLTALVLWASLNAAASAGLGRFFLHDE